MFALATIVFPEKRREYFASCLKKGGRLRSVCYFDPDDPGIDCARRSVQNFTTIMHLFDGFPNTGECFTLCGALIRNLR
jgi:hypothetical protein